MFHDIQPTKSHETHQNKKMKQTKTTEIPQKKCKNEYMKKKKTTQQQQERERKNQIVRTW
jgi:hypothetical protein